jgi:hypothetical protein
MVPVATTSGLGEIFCALAPASESMSMADARNDMKIKLARMIVVR